MFKIKRKSTQRIVKKCRYEDLGPNSWFVCCGPDISNLLLRYKWSATSSEPHIAFDSLSPYLRMIASNGINTEIYPVEVEMVNNCIEWDYIYE